jgi:hypothetical protein
MSLDAFDKEFLQRLMRLVNERGVPLALDRKRLGDPAYVVDLRKQHPLNTKIGQWDFAILISEATGQPLGLAEVRRRGHLAWAASSSDRDFDLLGLNRQRQPALGTYLEAEFDRFADIF